MRTHVKRAFTLIEILIVVVILGILAAIVIPQFTDASTQASESSVRSQLQTIRGQLELFRVQNNDLYPDMTDWDDLVIGNYLQAAPKNPLQNNSTTIAAAPAAGVGWVWVSTGANDPDSQLSAVAADGTLFVE